MAKIASIDIGTNTVLMLTANYEHGSTSDFEDFYEIPRIGKDLCETGIISQEKKELLLSVLQKFKGIALDKGVSHIILSGTNAFRIAKNSKEIVREIKEILKLDLKVISGEEEARLSFLGATGMAEGESFLVLDIGGGSTEIIRGVGGKPSQAISLPVGVVALTEALGGKNPPIFPDISILESELFTRFRTIPFSLNGTETVIAVAGTPTTLAAIKAGLAIYDENQIEGMTLTAEELHNFSMILNKMRPEEILQKYPIVKGREDVITAGNFILSFLCEFLGIRKVMVSTRGLRYGMLFEYIKTNPAILTE